MVDEVGGRWVRQDIYSDCQHSSLVNGAMYTCYMCYADIFGRGGTGFMLAMLNRM